MNPKARYGMFLLVAMMLLLPLSSFIAAQDKTTPVATPDPEATDEPDGGLEITIVIEGPVDEINVNLITVYGIDIALDADDPLLTAIQIGDIIRVEGELAQGDDHTIIIVAVTIIVVNVEVVVDSDTGEVWRDDGGCGNGPPAWAPAYGWRRRCEGNSGQSVAKDKDNKGNGKNK